MKKDKKTFLILSIIGLVISLINLFITSKYLFFSLFIADKNILSALFGMALISTIYTGYTTISDTKALLK